MTLSESSSHFNGLKVLIFGAGAIGTYVGGSLALAKHQVVFVEQPKVAEELRQRGLRLDLTLDRRRKLKEASRLDPAAFVIVPSLEDALRYGPFDVALFALKSFDTPAALEGILPFADKMPPILCLSNGVANEPAIADALGPDKVIYGTVTSAIGRRAAGDIVLERLRGLGIAKGHPLSETLHKEFNKAYLNAKLFDDANSMKWSKMLTNLIANPTSAILDMTAREVFAHRDLYRLEIEMLRECLAVMYAQDFKVVDLPGVPVSVLEFATTLPLWMSKPFLARAAGAGRGGKLPSFHIDLHSGRGKSEVQYLHGEVARAGEKFNVPAPVNKALTDILVALTNGDVPLDEFAHQPDKLLEKVQSKKLEPAASVPKAPVAVPVEIPEPRQVETLATRDVVAATPPVPLPKAEPREPEVQNGEISLIPPRASVEIQLPDERVLSGPRGSKVGQFLSALEFEAQVVAAVVNGELRELTYPIHIESRVLPVTMADPDGARIYRRSLTFLLEMAFNDLFPDGTLFVDHAVASGGYFCQVTGRQPLSEAEIETLHAHMQELVNADLPFVRMQIPIKEAIEYFHSRGYTDKVRLLSYRRKSYLTLYRLGERMDYHHGYMVPSTGYIKWFDLVYTEGGFTLRYPRRHKPNELLPMPEYPKLLGTFLQYGDWLGKLGIENVGSLNNAIQSGRSDQVVLVSEAFHENNLARIASQIVDQLDRSHIILIAGPSSSGKTTTSRRLTVQLLALGVSPFPLELDNYFLDRDKTPLGEDGKPDFEAIEALDLPLLADHLQRLIRGEEVQLPRYNFKTGLREDGERIRLKNGQPIILEGIHGMDPRLLPPSLSGEAFRIYVSALTQLNLDRHNRVSTTDTRLIRRIVRDARERGYTAMQTIGRWESVRRGEKRHIFPFQENADVMFNSALAYELAALKPFAEPLLRQVPHGTPEYIEAKRLLAFLEWFLPLDINLVPETSIVREFLGGSILQNFTIWKEQEPLV